MTNSLESSASESVWTEECTRIVALIFETESHLTSKSQSMTRATAVERKKYVKVTRGKPSSTPAVAYPLESPDPWLDAHSSMPRRTPLIRGVRQEGET